MKLTRNRLRIIRLATRGLTGKDIGKKLGRSEMAIKQQLRQIYDITGLSNRVELALWAIKHLGY